MSDHGDWEENSKYVLTKIDECAEEQERQAEINKTQSEFNHSIDKRVDKVTDRLTIIAALVGSGAATAVGSLKDIFNAIIHWLQN